MGIVGTVCVALFWLGMVLLFVGVAKSIVPGGRSEWAGNRPPNSPDPYSIYR